MKPYTRLQRKTLIFTNYDMTKLKTKKVTVKQRFDNLYHNIVEVQQTAFLNDIEGKIKAKYPMRFFQVANGELNECEIVGFGYKYFYGFVWEKVTKPTKSFLLSLQEKMNNFSFKMENVKVFVKVGGKQKTFIGGTYLNDLLEGNNMFATLEVATIAYERIENERFEKIRLIAKMSLPVGYDFTVENYQTASLNAQTEMCNEIISECREKGHPHLEMRKGEYNEHIIYCPTCKYAFTCDSSD